MMKILFSFHIVVGIQRIDTKLICIIHYEASQVPNTNINVEQTIERNLVEQRVKNKT